MKSTPEQIAEAQKLIDKHKKATGETGPVELVMIAKKPKAVKTSDHPPCGDCGNTFFLRTGTCHVCQTCGASQGCS